MRATLLSQSGAAIVGYYAHRYGAGDGFVIESIYRHFSAADTEFSEEEFARWSADQLKDPIAHGDRLRGYYASRYERAEAEVEEIVFLTFARADTEFSVETFWAYFDRFVDPGRTAEQAQCRAELAAHFPVARQAAIPSALLHSIRNLRRENEENKDLADAFAEKVSAYRCPYAPDKALRGVHPKSYGVVDGLFEIDERSATHPTLPREQRVGLFAQLGATFRCKIRLSGSGGLPFEVMADTFARQSHGLALKLLDDEGQTIHDFLFNNAPVFPSKDPRSAIPISEDAAGESTLAHVDAVLATASDPGQPLLMDQYSISAYAWGPDEAIKYGVFPEQQDKELLEDADYQAYRSLLDAGGENYRAEAVAFLLEHLKEELRLDFCVQFAESTSSPIDDETVPWPGSWHHVATARISPQPPAERQNTATDEDLVFSSYQISSRDHLPLGRLNRARLWAYQTSAKTRHTHNQVQRAPHPYKSPDSLRVAVVGAGAAGLSAALALTEFGYRVDVFEKRGQIGGHACTQSVYGGQHLRDPAFGAFRKRQWPNFYSLLKTLDVEPISLGTGEDWFDSPFIGWFREGGEPVAQSPDVMDEGRRFAAALAKALRDPENDAKTVGELIAELDLSRAFLCTWFMGGVILYFGGHPLQTYLDYPLRLIAWMWQNSIGDESGEPVELLRVQNAGYMQAFERYLEERGVQIHTSASVTVTHRSDDQVRLRVAHGDAPSQERVYGKIILAIQPHLALEVLGGTATPEERQLLSNFEYTTDTVVVHRDENYLPRDRGDWKLANIRLPSGQEFPANHETLPYTLQVPCDRDGETITLATYDYAASEQWPNEVDRFTFQHLRVTPHTQRLRRELAAIDGAAGVSFCGSWTRGLTLHEDAVVSGLRAANQIMAPWSHFEVLSPPVPLPEPFEACAHSGARQGLGGSRESVRIIVQGLLEELVELGDHVLNDDTDVQGLGLSSLHLSRFANALNAEMPADADEEIDITMLLQMESLGEVIDYVFELTHPGHGSRAAEPVDAPQTAEPLSPPRRDFVAQLKAASPSEKPLPTPVVWLAQLTAIACLFGAVALSGATSLYLASWLYESGGLLGGLAALPVAWMAYGGVYCALALAVKWGVVGRLKPCCVPIYGSTHLRWWTANLFLNFAQQTFLLPFRDSYLPMGLLRLLGARIHPSATLNTDGLNPAISLVDADLLDVAERAYIRRGALVQAHLFVDGHLVLAPVSLGPHSVVWTRGVMEPGTRLEARAILETHSVLSMGGRLAEGLRARGVVAESVGPHTETGVHATGHGHKLTHTVMGALVLPFLMAGAGALFWLLLTLFVPHPTLQVLEWRLWLSLWPVFILTTILLGAGTCALKWVLVGRVQPERAEAELGLRFAVVKFVSFLTSRLVLFCPRDMRWLFLRGMGARVAFGSVTDCPLMEVAYADLLTLAPGAFFSPAAFIDFATLRDGKVMLAPVHLEPAAYAGAYATLAAPIHFPSFSVLAAASALAPDAEVKGGEVWVGAPAKSVPISLGEAEEESHSISGSSLLKNRVIDLANHYAITLLFTLLPLLGYHLFAGQISLGVGQFDFGATLIRGLALVAFAYVGNTFFLLPILRADTELLRWLCKRDAAIRTEGFERDSWEFNVWHLMSNHLLPYGFLTDLYAGTPLQIWLARRLGARVGKRVYFANGVGIREFTFTLIADDVALNRGAALIAHSELPNGRIVMKDIALEAGSCIAYNAYVVAGTVVPAGALLGSLSRPFEGQELEADGEYNNTPCKRR